MWSGEVPQQPPTMLTKPGLAQSAISVGQLLRRLVVAAEGVRQAGVRVRRDEAVADMRDSSSTYWRSSLRRRARS
jgi:hypothetical protein